LDGVAVRRANRKDGFVLRKIPSKSQLGKFEIPQSFTCNVTAYLKGVQSEIAQEWALWRVAPIHPGYWPSSKELDDRSGRKSNHHRIHANQKYG